MCLLFIVHLSVNSQLCQFIHLRVLEIAFLFQSVHCMHAMGATFLERLPVSTLTFGGSGMCVWDLFNFHFLFV